MKSTKPIQYHAISRQLQNDTGGQMSITPCTYISVTVKKRYKNKMHDSCHESAAFGIYANLLQHIFSQAYFNGNCSAHAINNHDTLQGTGLSPSVAI